VPTQGQRPQADRERHNDAVADFQLLVVLADFDDLAHGLVAHDIATVHVGHKTVVEMKIGAADRASGGHFDDGIPTILDLRISEGFAARSVLSASPPQ
jgi:hypothetical protein